MADRDFDRTVAAENLREHTLETVVDTLVAVQDVSLPDEAQSVLRDLLELVHASQSLATTLGHLVEPTK